MELPQDLELFWGNEGYNFFAPAFDLNDKWKIKDIYNIGNVKWNE
jgi:hypothetical protein